MKKTITSIFFSLFSPFLFAQGTSSELLIGVVPNLSARVISTHYQPLAEYFEKSLNRKTVVTTAANFPSFYQRALNNEFQIMVTAPNLARVSQTDGNWEVIAVFEPGIPGILVGLLNSPNKLEALRGKKLAVANPQSLVGLSAINWLASQGYQLNKDYEILRIANDDSLGVALKTGEAPFAVMSQGEFNAKDLELRKLLTPVTTFVRLPGFFILVNSNLSTNEKQRIRGLTLDFPKSEYSKSFFSLTGFTGMTQPSSEQLKFLDQFVTVTRQGLSPAK